MKPQKKIDRRTSPRRLINRIAQIHCWAQSSSRDCLLTDISEGGVRLHVEGVNVPNDFTLFISGEGVAEKRACRVVWRLGHEIGASFVNPRSRSISSSLSKSL
jgi:PilZ domain